MGIDPHTDGRARSVAGVVAFIGSALKWFLVLNIGIGWFLFWVNFARLHLALGDLQAALLTVVLFIVPPVVAIPWWLVRKADLVVPDAEKLSLESLS